VAQLKEKTMADTKKPELHLLDAGDSLSVDDLATMYKSLTGRDMTPEELAEAESILTESE
jgi:hypothetical protein